MATTDDLLIAGTSVQSWADITDFSGVLSDGPQLGDLIEIEGQSGAVWLPGGKGTYSFEVPLLMKSDDEDTALGQLQSLQGLVGAQVTLTRTAAGVHSQCDAVIINAVQVLWDLEARHEVNAVLIFQNLSGTWTLGGGPP